MTICVEAPDGTAAVRLARDLACCGEAEAAPVDATGWQVTLSSPLDDGQVTVYVLGIVMGWLRSGLVTTARVRVGSPHEAVDALCELRPGFRGSRKRGVRFAGPPPAARESLA